jgi:hypothetical protein
LDVFVFVSRFSISVSMQRYFSALDCSFHLYLFVSILAIEYRELATQRIRCTRARARASKQTPIRTKQNGWAARGGGRGEGEGEAALTTGTPAISDVT